MTSKRKTQVLLNGNLAALSNKLSVTSGLVARIRLRLNLLRERVIDVENSGASVLS